MDTKKICSGCKKPLEPNAPDGLCPQCHTETDLKPVCEPCEDLAQRRRGLLMEAA